MSEMCPNCKKRARWWQTHYLNGALPGYMCEKEPAMSEHETAFQGVCVPIRKYRELEAECDRLREERNLDALRKANRWPTPNAMRQAAAALDRLTAPRYGDVLRWVADQCDLALEGTSD